MAWFFAAPFVCLARDAALHNDYNVFRFPACGVLYGKSNAGKTDLIKILMRAMFGHEWWLVPKDFTTTNFHGLAERGGSFPIVVDDISRDRFRDPAVSIIKNDFRLGLYPVLVLSTNQDVRAVETEVLKRAVVVHADASMPVAMSTRNSLVTRISRTLGTALYRHYAGEMLNRWPEFTSGFHGHGDEAGTADLVNLSSSIIRRTFATTLGEIPQWCSPVGVDTLVAMNGRKIKDRMRSQWEYKRNSFELDRRANHLIMTVDDQMDRNDYRKDLPSFVIYDVRQEKVIMWLDKAEEFFGIRFSGSGFAGAIRRMLGRS